MSGDDEKALSKTEQRRADAKRTTDEAKARIGEELAARHQKTARLKELRLEKEAADQESERAAKAAKAGSKTVRSKAKTPAKQSSSKGAG